MIEQDKGLKLPKRLQADFSRHVQALADETSRELGAADIWGRFEATYLPREGDRFVLRDYEERGTAGDRLFVGRVAVDGEERSISGRGNGLISGVIAALGETTGRTSTWSTIASTPSAMAPMRRPRPMSNAAPPMGGTVFGVGLDTDIATASVRRAQRRQPRLILIRSP